MYRRIYDATAKVYAQVLGNNRNNSQLRDQARGAARAQMAKLQASHNRVLAFLNSPGMKTRVLYRVQTAYNGIAARVDAADVAKIRAHVDVKAVHALPVHTIDNSTSVPFINAVNAWVAAGGERRRRHQDRNHRYRDRLHPRRLRRTGHGCGLQR